MFQSLLMCKYYSEFTEFQILFLQVKLQAVSITNCMYYIQQLNNLIAVKYKQVLYTFHYIKTKKGRHSNAQNILDSKS